MAGISNIYIHSILKKTVTNFDGVYSCNNIPSKLLKQSTFCVVCNLAKENEPGTHFITLIKQARKLLIYDSLALSLTLYPVALKKLFTLYKPVIMCSTPLQTINSTFCGFYCILFVLRYNYPFIKITPFSTPKINDNICIRNIEKIIKQT